MLGFTIEKYTFSNSRNSYQVLLKNKQINETESFQISEIYGAILNSFKINLEK